VVCAIIYKVKGFAFGIVFSGISTRKEAVVAKIQLFKRIAQVTSSWGLLSAFSWVYDNPLWIFIIAWLGVGTGSLIMTFGAMLLNFGFLVVYQKYEIDWLGVSGFANLKEHGDKWAQKVQSHHNFFIRTIFWIPALFFRLLVCAVRKNNALAFIALSIQTDSFITTAFLRGKVGGKLSQKDYVIFIGSTTLSCIYWSLRNGVILTILKGGWEVTKQFFN
jgi:hypothetical protein